MTFGAVLEWNDPSSVSWHLEVAPGKAYSTLLHIPLNDWFEIEKFLAEAAPTRAPKKSVAPSRPSSVRIIFTEFPLWFDNR